MRTLIISPELFATEGGISRIMRLYVRALVEKRLGTEQIGLVVLNDGNEVMERTRRLGGERLVSADNCGRSKLRFGLSVLRRTLRADRAICGHLHQLSAVWLAALLRPSLRYYVVAHGIEVWRPYSLFERLALRGAHRVICISEYTRRQILRFCRSLDPQRLVVLPNTFDPAFLTAATIGRPATAPAKPRILVVSRLSSTDSYKGIDTMIEAMPGIRRLFPQAQLRIVGDGNDRPRLEALARSLQMNGAVEFTGLVPDVVLQDEYRACNLFALPSRREGFGLVYLEAMAYGKPCLAARAGGAPEVVNREVGVLVDYGRIDQIILAVADLISNPRDERVILQWVRTFSFSAFSGKLQQILTD